MFLHCTSKYRSLISLLMFLDLFETQTCKSDRRKVQVNSQNAVSLSTWITSFMCVPWWHQCQSFPASIQVRTWACIYPVCHWQTVANLTVRSKGSLLFTKPHPGCFELKKNHNRQYSCRSLVIHERAKVFPGCEAWFGELCFTVLHWWYCLQLTL